MNAYALFLVAVLSEIILISLMVKITRDGIKQYEVGRIRRSIEEADRNIANIARVAQAEIVRVLLESRRRPDEPR